MEEQSVMEDADADEDGETEFGRSRRRGKEDDECFYRTSTDAILIASGEVLHSRRASLKASTEPTSPDAVEIGIRQDTMVCPLIISLDAGLTTSVEAPSPDAIKIGIGQDTMDARSMISSPEAKFMMPAVPASPDADEISVGLDTMDARSVIDDSDRGITESGELVSPDEYVTGIGGKYVA